MKKSYILILFPLLLSGCAISRERTPRHPSSSSSPSSEVTSEESSEEESNTEKSTESSSKSSSNPSSSSSSSEDDWWDEDEDSYEEPPEYSRDGDWMVSSPSGKIKFALKLDDGAISYGVKYGDDIVVNQSNLGLTVDYFDFSDASYVTSTKSSTPVHFTYNSISGKARAHDVQYNDLAVKFIEEDFYLTVEARLFNDGYGFRYKLDAIDGSSGSVTISDEGTYFSLPNNTTILAQQYVGSKGVDSGDSHSDYFSYEANFDNYSYNSMGGNQLAFPILYNFGNNNYSLLTEADLYGKSFHGSFLQKKGSYGLKTIHAPGCGDNPSLVSKYPFTSPWRVAAVGSLSTIVESTINEDIYGDVEPWKPDNYDSLSSADKLIYNYDWVEPGLGGFTYLNHADMNAHGQNDFSLQRSYVNAWSALGFKWVILDAGWAEPLNEDELKEFCSYANARGMKVMVWCDSFKALNTRAAIMANLTKWKKLGIEGVKVDFYDGQTQSSVSKNSKAEAQSVLDSMYEPLYQEAAKLKIVVDCHGCNKPTGERRIYPHVFNREAIRGTEFMNINSDQVNKMAYTRAAIGPVDFTPAVYPKRNNTITTGNTLGFMVVFESGNHQLSDHYGKLNGGQNYLEFLSSYPAKWEKTVFVGGSPSTYTVVARKGSNGKWFVGCVNNPTARTIHVDFKFLESGNHSVKLFKDNSNYAVSTESFNTTSSGGKDVYCRSGGGFAMIIQ